ncbi:MAG: ankyrin repeat domain-containing protein, partial [Nitrospinaceae bacterium]|nr:ankyrin repeat domain-containing protein [Nitrospinaceae bacterium]
MKHLLLTTIAAVMLVGCATTPIATIHTSAQTGNVESVKQFLANGTDVNVKDVSKWTPLHIAAQFGHEKLVELLLF